MAIETVELPIKDGDIPYSSVGLPAGTTQKRSQTVMVCNRNK